MPVSLALAIVLTGCPDISGENEKSVASTSKSQTKEDTAAKKVVRLIIIDETMNDGALKTGVKQIALSKSVRSKIDPAI